MQSDGRDEDVDAAQRRRAEANTRSPLTMAAEPEPAGGWSNRRWYAIAAVALVIVAVIGVVVATNSSPSSVAGPVDVHHLSTGPAPPALTDAKGWLNSPPLGAAQLHGKVVLHDFWTYSCVNCVREIPRLRAWYDRYAPDGLVVVGIHSPEFDFEKDHGNVTSASQRLQVNYPVALDDDMDLWNAFGNQYWPEGWVADRAGHLRYQSIGEGNYAQTENVLRALLGVPASAPRATVTGGANFGQPPASNQPITPETYLGTDKGSAGAVPGLITYPNVGAIPADTARLVGPWNATGQAVQAAGSGAAVVLNYEARAANLVMAPAAGPVAVVVELDGKPLPPADRTAATHVNAAGQTSVEVTSSDLYPLVLTRRVERHTLRLIAQAPGVQAFAFTFGA
jgi:thiol-disulfide isomerase/thioredoxin